MSDPKNHDDADDPYRAIRVGDPGGAGEGTKWGQLLTRFMRVMAIFWLLQGLMQWYAILTAQKPIFDAMPQSAALAIILFSMLDLVAGVGLWLATPWGGVLWLLIASAQIFVAAGIPRFFAGGYWLIGVNLVLIVLYFALTFEAGRDFEAQNQIDRRRKRANVIGLDTSVEPASPEGPPPSAPAARIAAMDAAAAPNAVEPARDPRRKSAPPSETPSKAAPKPFLASAANTSKRGKEGPKPRSDG